MSLLAAGAAGAAGYLVGAPWWAAAGFLGACALAGLARGLGRLLLLLAAPVVFSAFLPLPSLLAAPAAGAVVALALALVPLAKELGPPPALLRAGGVVAVSVTAALLFLAFTPPGSVLAASDLSAGATTLALLAGLVASTVAVTSGRIAL